MITKFYQSLLKWDASGLLGRLLDAELRKAAALRWKLMVWQPLCRLFQPAPVTSYRRRRPRLQVEELEVRTMPSSTVTLSSSAYTVAESAGSVTIGVVLNTASSQAITVNYSTANGTATAGTEYTAESGTLSIAAGQTTGSVVVPILNDPLPGATENFGVMLSSPTNASLGSPSSAGVTIVEPAPTISLSSSAISVAEGSGSVTITAVLSAASAQAITVNYATANGTATAGTEYTGVTGTLHFAAGQTSQSFTVPILNDPLPGATENFSVALSSPSNASLGSPSSATVTITEPVPSVWLSSSAYAAAETAASVAITAALSMASAQAVTVHYTTVDGTATAGTEYTAESGTLSIAAGQTSGTIVVPILNDPLPGATENFGVVLSSPGNASLGSPSSAGVTIIEPTPTVAIGNVTANEDASGTAPFAFNVSLSAASAQTITVGYSTANGTASAGSNYSSASGTVTFAPGQTTQTVVVGVSGNLGSATSENFNVNLSSPSNATLGASQGVGTILNNALSPVTFDQSYTVSPDTSLSVAFPGIAGTADDPSGNWLALATVDGMPVTFGSPITLPSGATFTPAADGSFVYVPATGFSGTDALVYTLTDGTYVSNPATVSIQVVAPAITVSNMVANEPASGTEPMTFTATLSAPSSQTITVHYSTADSSAVAGTNYTATSGTLTFAPGQTTQIVTVPVSGNLGSATSAEFNLNLSSPANATLAHGQVTGTILNSSQDPVVSNQSYVVSPNTELSIDAPGLLGTSTDPSGNPLTVATINGAPVSFGTPITLSSGASLTPYDDGSFDYDPATNYTGTDTFSYTLTDGTYISNAATVSVQVVNPSLSVTNVTANQPGSGSAPFTATVSLSEPTNETVTVNYATADGTALAGTNYTSTSGTLTFAPGQTSETLTIPVNGNLGSAASANFYLNLSSPSNATLAQSQAVMTVLNNTQAPTLGNESFDAAPDTTFTSAAAALLGNASDPGNNTMTVATVNGEAVTAGTPMTLPSGGQMTVNADGSFSYLPPSGFLGTDSFTYTVTDGTYQSDPATASINVVVPTLSIADVTANEPGSGTSLFTFTLSLSAASGDDVTVNWQTADGTVAAGTNYTAASGSVDFAPGETSQTVTVNVNGDLGSATSGTFYVELSSPAGTTLGQATATATILNNTLAPVAPNTSFTDTPDTTLSASSPGLLTGASDPSDLTLSLATINGAAVTVGSVVTLPSGGTVTVGSNGACTYTPATGYVGTDSFTYTLTDGTYVSNVATASIVVSAGAPVYEGSNSYTALSGVALPIDVVDGTYDPNGQAPTIINLTGPSNGTVTLMSTGLLEYQSNTGYTGSDSFTYQLTDGISTSSVQTITVDVVQQALVANPVTILATPGAEVALNIQDLLLSDESTNGATLTITPDSSPSSGTLSTGAQGSWWYLTPSNPAYVGTVNFLATISNSAASAVVPILVNFLQAPAAPVNSDFTTTNPSALSSDGSTLATIGPTTTITIFNTQPTPATGTIQFGRGPANIVAVNFVYPRSNNYLAIAYNDRGQSAFGIWSFLSGGFIGQGPVVLPAGSGQIRSLSGSSDGTQLLVTTSTGVSLYQLQYTPPADAAAATYIGGMNLPSLISATILPEDYQGAFAIQVTQSTGVSIWSEVVNQGLVAFRRNTNLDVTVPQLNDPSNFLPGGGTISASAGSILSANGTATGTLALLLTVPPGLNAPATTTRVFLVTGPPQPSTSTNQPLPWWTAILAYSARTNTRQVATSIALASTPATQATRTTPAVPGRTVLAIGNGEGRVQFFNVTGYQSDRPFHTNRRLTSSLRPQAAGWVTGIVLAPVATNRMLAYSTASDGSLKFWNLAVSSYSATIRRNGIAEITRSVPLPPRP